MSAAPGSPLLLKGAIVGLDLLNPVPMVVPFQYNPDQLTRTLTANQAGEGADSGEALRLRGPPRETIQLEVELDAADALEKARPPEVLVGVYPMLSALEMFLYPRSAGVLANAALAAAGIIELIPAQAPLTLLVWGPQRVLPVRLTEFSVTEEAFDTRLNPIRARVRLGLRVLTYQDLGLASVGGVTFMVHQVAKEIMATLNAAGSLTGAVSFGVGVGNGG
ncbi:hypothetical protein [Myxococcus sp. RHSTA-1-4]|uniref:hypothetical protein n=1 Tax=Myxococcus sp. RHSTA-1-4 TaxID=2874601 RepID=UPI001CBF56DB|nr:hypothetical protein [Myxococcus sp. RHSTA-1-4]MBZ4415591.1 hypothetical protein [Myxococcus sp. RHSTA-1-4]